MKLGIMQPYIFPYIGYWQLLNSVDCFVILDDVNFIRRGYMNRNSILINNKAYRFTIPIMKASQNRLICDTKIMFTDKEKKLFLQRIEFAYKKAPYYKQAYPIIQKIINHDNDDFTEYAYNSIKILMAYLSIDTQIVLSSNIEKNSKLHGQDRIIEICKKMGADTYINPSGGRNLYSSEAFTKERISLYFLDQTKEKIKYKQFNSGFVDNLSIIDIIMFNSVEDIRKMLKECELKGI